MESGLRNKPLSIALEEIGEGKTSPTAPTALAEVLPRGTPGPARRHRRHRRVQGLCAARLLTAGATVQVVMTRSATRFVGPDTFAALTGRPVRTDLWEDPGSVLHVRLAHEADLAIVAPLTANVLAKLAHGLADDLLTSTLLEDASARSRPRCTAACGNTRPREGTRTRWPSAARASSDPSPVRSRTATRASAAWRSRRRSSRPPRRPRLEGETWRAAGSS